MAVKTQYDFFVSPQTSTQNINAEDPRVGDTSLNQFFTPFWAAEAIVNNYFPGLGSSDLVIEPTCGTGAFLSAIPQTVPAIGIEIDAELADKARNISGRKVITGDFRNVPIEVKPTLVLGNPPFTLALFNEILERSYTMLPKGGPVAMIVPAFFFQTAKNVTAYRHKWGLTQEALPRNIFPGLSVPLCFGIWEKDLTNKLCGFFLYDETTAFKNMGTTFQKILSQNTKGIWYGLVEAALTVLGGEAALEQLYKIISPARPLTNRFWKEKIRQTARRHFTRVGVGRYSLAG